jgi:hypothetical protein
VDRKDDYLCTQIVHAWIGMFIVFASMLLMQVLQLLIDDNVEMLYLDPGISGMKVLISIEAFYAMMMVLTHLVHPVAKLRPLRWLLMVAGLLTWMYFITHHAGHYTQNERPDFFSNVLDLTHHVLGLWLVITSVRWARYSPATDA